MGLIYANLCTQCKSRKTKHPSGLCCRCRRTKETAICRICRTALTSSPDGICYDCKRRARIIPNTDVEYRLNEAIEETRTTLFILEQRKNKVTFEEISEMIGLSKSATYSRYRRAMNMDAFPGGFDDDGTYIKGEERKPRASVAETPEE